MSLLLDRSLVPVRIVPSLLVAVAKEAVRGPGFLARCFVRCFFCAFRVTLGCPTEAAICAWGGNGAGGS